MAKERKPLQFYSIGLTIKVIGPLYASSATTKGGIVAALNRNQPTEPQLAYRQAHEEEIIPMEKLAEEIEAAIPTDEYPPDRIPSTVFRRDSENKPYLHANYFKGHLRDCGEAISRTVNFWGLKDFVTKTVRVRPNGIPLTGYEIKTFTSFFTPEVRASKTGIVVKQPTEKIEEFIDGPILSWILYMVADPRWERGLLNDMLKHGSQIRGIGPGRGRCESYYTFELDEKFLEVDEVPAGDPEFSPV